MTFNLFATKKAAGKRVHPEEIMVEFLSSADWISKTDDFLEKESIIFEPTSADGEEHQRIFEMYKNMAIQCLEDFCRRQELSTEQMRTAASYLKTEAQTNSYLKNLMYPWTIQENFDSFKEAMVQENVESQMLALESIGKRTGTHPFTAAQTEEFSEDSVAQLEEEVFQQTLRKSKEEYDELQRQLREEEDAIERALRESERLSQMLISTSETHISVHDLREFVKQSEALTVVREEEEEEKDHSAVNEVPTRTQSNLAEILSKHDPDQFVSVKQFISPEELRRRQAYLRGQKEKIHSKRETLEEQRAGTSTSTSNQEPSPTAALSRKELAKILKSKIVGDSKGP